MWGDLFIKKFCEEQESRSDGERRAYSGGRMPDDYACISKILNFQPALIQKTHGIVRYKLARQHDSFLICTQLGCSVI